MRTSEDPSEPHPSMATLGRVRVRVRVRARVRVKVRVKGGVSARLTSSLPSPHRFIAALVTLADP